MYFKVLHDLCILILVIFNIEIYFLDGSFGAGNQVGLYQTFIREGQGVRGSWAKFYLPEIDCQSRIFKRLSKNARAVGCSSKALYNFALKIFNNEIQLLSQMKLFIKQVFSNSVRGTLQYFQKFPKFHGCGATASFCQWLNDMFDALNRTDPINGVQPGNVDFKVCYLTVQ